MTRFRNPPAPAAADRLHATSNAATRGATAASRRVAQMLAAASLAFGLATALLASPPGALAGPGGSLLSDYAGDSWLAVMGHAGSTSVSSSSDEGILGEY